MNVKQKSVPDIHIHTLFSPDGKELPENYVVAAKKRGDGIIGFSDHCEYNMRKFDPDFPLLDVPAYFRELDRLAAAYPDVKILKGVELGYADDAVELYTDILARNEFDYAIMSVHTVGIRGDCYFPEFYSGLDKRAAFELYLKEVLRSATCYVPYSILGHIGYVSRYAPYSDKRLMYSEFPELIDEILSAVISRGAALELNTSTRGMPGDFVTDISIAERYIALGGTLFTFGSDAHSLSRYAENADKAKAFLSSHGIFHTVHFERGEPVKDHFE